MQRNRGGDEEQKNQERNFSQNTSPMPRLAPSAKIERRSIREKINSSDDPYTAMDTLMTTVALSKQP